VNQPGDKRLKFRHSSAFGTPLFIGIIISGGVGAAVFLPLIRLTQSMWIATAWLPFVFIPLWAFDSLYTKMQERYLIDEKCFKAYKKKILLWQIDWHETVEVKYVEIPGRSGCKGFDITYVRYGIKQQKTMHIKKGQAKMIESQFSKEIERKAKHLSSKQINIAIMISGSGTNMMAVIEAVKQGVLNAKVVLVVASSYRAEGAEKSRMLDIPTVVCPLDDYKSREKRDKAILKQLIENEVELVVLAGYLGILTDCLLDGFKGRIINIHPSLLPKHGGAGMYGLAVHKSVIDAGDKETGATVHYVGKEIDGGEIIMQRSIPVLSGDTPEILANRVLRKVEHGLLVDAIYKVITNC